MFLAIGSTSHSLKLRDFPRGMSHLSFFVYFFLLAKIHKLQTVIAFSVLWKFLFIYLVILFSIYSVLWIRSNEPALKIWVIKSELQKTCQKSWTAKILRWKIMVKGCASFFDIDPHCIWAQLQIIQLQWASKIRSFKIRTFFEDWISPIDQFSKGWTILVKLLAYFDK